MKTLNKKASSKTVMAYWWYKCSCKCKCTSRYYPNTTSASNSGYTANHTGGR